MKNILIIALFGALMFTIMNIGYDKSMKVKCLKLQNEAVEMVENPHYYVTKLDHTECKESYQIEIDAPVK